MATYLVLRRITWGDRSASFANEVLELDPLAKETAIFLKRGHITPVPPDYPGAASPPAMKAAAAFKRPGSPSSAKTQPSAHKTSSR